MSGAVVEAGIRLTADGSGLVGAAEDGAGAVDGLNDSLARMKRSSEAAAAEQKKLTGSLDVVTQAQVNSRYASQQAAEEWARQTTSMGALSDQAQRLLNRYDPLGTKLRALQAEFSMLNKEVAAGAGQGQDTAIDATYKGLKEEIARTKGLMAEAGVATDGSSMSMKGLGLNTQFARRELMMLGREALTGDFSQMPRTFGSLVAHANLLPLLLNPVTIAIALIGVTATAMAIAIEKGRKEQEAMNTALQMTGNFAGTSTGALSVMAEQVGKTGRMTVGTAKEVIQQILDSGRYSEQNIAKMAGLADNYAKVTGESVEKLTPKLIQMFEDPAKASERLNQQYHYLSASQLQHIIELQQAGDKQAAVTAAIDAFADRVPDATAKVGLFGKAWDSVAKGMSDVWNNLKKINQEDTPQSALAAAQARLNTLTAAATRETPARANQRVIDFSGSIADARADLDLQKALVADLETSAKLEAQITKNRQDGVDAQLKINTSAVSNLNQLRAERKFIADNGAGSAAKDRKLWEINTQIANLTRQMAEETSQDALVRARASVRYNAEKDASDRELKLLEDAHVRGLVEWSVYYDKKVGVQRAALQARERLLQDELEIERRALRLAQPGTAQRAAAQGRVEGVQGQMALVSGQQGDVGRDIRLQRDLWVKAKQQQGAADELSERDQALAQRNAVSDARGQQVLQMDKELRLATKQAEIAAMADSRARTLAQFDFERQQRQLRINDLLPDSIARKTLEDDLASWTVARQAQMTQELKPEWQKMLEGWQDATRGMRDVFNNFVLAGLRQGEQMWVKFAQTGKFSMADLSNFIIGEVARIQYQQQIAPILSQGLQGLGGLIAGAFRGGANGLPDVLTGEWHEGGDVGAGGNRQRYVSSALFAGAPHLHNGLQPDEFPAILQKGERVLSRAEVAAGGGGPGSFVYAPNLQIDARGADAGVEARLRASFKALLWENSKTVAGLVERHSMGKGRRMGLAG